MSIETKEYNREITSLINQMKSEPYMQDRKALSLLKKLEKENEKLKDDDLYGYIYYNYSRITSFRDDHDKLMKYLTKAIYYLLRSDDKELLARAYNIFAVEASRNGCLEIAYEYFCLGKSYVESEKLSVVGAMIDANIGANLYQLGDKKGALACINRSQRIIQRHKGEPSFFGNFIMLLLNKALINVSLGEVAKAKTLLAEVESYDEEKELGDWHLILRARIAVMSGDKEASKKLVEQVGREIVAGPMFSEVAKDLKDLCQDLINKEEYALLGKLLEEVDRNKDRISPFEIGLFTQVKIHYYTAIKDEEGLLESYDERSRYSQALDETEKKMNYESIQLMRLMVDLRYEKQKAKEENAKLQKQAETDALTGLPNRYALNKELERVFSEALERGEMIGVGITDIDSFKDYNDTYGHQQGDRCLMYVANMLEGVAGKYGLFVARYGGDEFTFIYRGVDEDTVKKIEKEISQCGDVRLSHGFYMAVPDEESKMWDYFNRADKNLYDGRKRRG